jgi:signal transduction histidine kinase
MRDIERERDFYRQQCNELGKQIIQLQGENARIRRDADRCRVLSRLIRQAYQMSNATVSMSDLGNQFLEIIVGTIGCDCAFIGEYVPPEKCFNLLYSLGFKKTMPTDFTLAHPIKNFGYVSSIDSPDSFFQQLFELTGVPYAIWAFEEKENLCILLGNEIEDKQFKRPFEGKDREIVEGVLKVLVEIREKKLTETELMRAKEDAETANKSKSEFLANMSHELRTPLNHIIGFTEIVVDQHFGSLNDAQQDFLNDVLASSKHLLSLINDILDLSKVEAGKLTLELTEVDLRAVIEGCCNMIREKALKHGFSLTVETDGIPDIIKADERKIRQILYNLLSNASKFTPDGGKIHLAAKKAACEVQSDQLKFIERPVSGEAIGDFKMKECILISIADTGIGIDQKDLNRIFEPFEQLDTSASRKFSGTGLGLPLSRRFVELHGGKIWAESDGIHKGSTFHFLIPA